MATPITTRSGKGSELSWNEVDNNFTNLKNTADAAEEVINKSTSVDTDKASNTKYPTVKAVFDWATSQFQRVVNKDNTDGYVGLTTFNINFKNVANTFTSYFTNTNTASRTYAFPDKAGTIALANDVRNYNHIINGRLEFWQRGTSQFTSGYGSVDRFLSAFIGSTLDIYRESFSPGQTDVEGNPNYFLRSVVVAAAGASNYAAISHRIESVASLSGKTCVLSFSAKTDGTRPIAIEFEQFFGTGGGSPSVTGIGVTKIWLTTVWQRFEIPVVIPSIAGKALGPNKDDFLSVNIWFDAGTDYNSRTDALGRESGTFDIAMLKLEEGSIATPIEPLDYNTELGRCQRYFEKSYPIGVRPGTPSSDGAFLAQVAGLSSAIRTINVPYRFRTRKRAAPTMTFYNMNTGTTGKLYDHISGEISVIGAGADESGGRVWGQQSAAQTSYEVYAQFTANAEL